MKVAPPGFEWCGEKGDLTIYLTHVQFPEDHEEHGALYIRNEHRTNIEGGCPVFLVPLRDLWEFRPEDRDRGKNHRYDAMHEYLANASIALYGLDVPMHRHRIHDALLEFADDVKNLKPPAEIKSEDFRAMMERHGVVLRINGERVH